MQTLRIFSNLTSRRALNGSRPEGGRVHGVEGFPDWAGIDISRAPVADQHGTERRNENGSEYAVRRQLGEIGNQARRGAAPPPINPK